MFKHAIRNAIGLLATLLGVVTQGVSAQPLPPLPWRPVRWGTGFRGGS